MSPERTRQILEMVEQRGRIPNDTTATEVEQLNDMIFYEDESWILTTLGEMELEELTPAKP